MKAHPVYGTGEKAKDPIFGLTMGGNSQTSTDLFRYSLKYCSITAIPPSNENFNNFHFFCMINSYISLNSTFFLLNFNSSQTSQSSLNITIFIGWRIESDSRVGDCSAVIEGGLFAGLTD